MSDHPTTPQGSADRAEELRDEELDHLESLWSGLAPAPWGAYRMTDANTGQPITPEAFGEYARRSVEVSAEQSGSTDIYFVGCEKPDGFADVCHLGNGPTSSRNAAAIAAAREAVPKLLEEVRTLRRRCAEREAQEAELERLREELQRAQRAAEETRADFRDATGVGYPEFREKRGTFGRDYAKAWLRGDPDAARFARRLPPVKPQPQEASEGQEGDRV